MFFVGIFSVLAVTIAPWYHRIRTARNLRHGGPVFGIKLKRRKHNLYIFDELTTGLHFADIERLLLSLNRLVENGQTVLVIGHNLDVIKTADHMIDLGPEGGHKGGKIRASGTSEKVAKSKTSHTGKFLKKCL